jgi:putative transposase
MPRKRHKPEEIVTKLRQVDVLVSQGQGIADAIRQIGVSEVTYYRWRQEFGGLKTEQVKRLKDLETENNRLRRAYCISHHYRRYSWMRVVRSPARPCWSIDDCHERNSSTVSI